MGHEAIGVRNQKVTEGMRAAKCLQESSKGAQCCLYIPVTVSCLFLPMAISGMFWTSFPLGKKSYPACGMGLSREILGGVEEASPQL